MPKATDVKLIACDLDGTLRPADQNSIPEENLRAIERAGQAGILFCPATGRTFHSTCGLIGDLPRKCCCITENGGTVYAPGGIPVAERTFDREMTLEICRHILSFPDNHLVMTGRDTVFVLRGDDDFADFLRDIVFERVLRIDSPEEVTVPLTKLTAFGGNTETMFRQLSEGWTDRCNVAIAGDCVVDYTMADKGTGVEDICRHLHIPLENVMAIGDNYNDLPMLECVGFPVLMEGAAEPLHERYPHTCATVAEAIESLLK